MNTPHNPQLHKHNVRHWLYLTVLTLGYKVFHLKNDKYNGWFVKKNPVTMIVIAPIVLPFFMIYGIFLYWSWATNWYYHWIDGEKQKLTFKQRLYIKDQLVD
jgi:hypothetical protein